MTRIIAHYFPRDFDLESMFVEHLDRDSCIHVAEQRDKIIGFSVSSCCHRKTPFQKKIYHYSINAFCM